MPQIISPNHQQTTSNMPLGQLLYIFDVRTVFGEAFSHFWAVQH